jgi:acyl dehydratase
MAAAGFAGNVAVSYDIQFHRFLVEGDRAHHYTSIVAISDCKTTALGEGYFVSERVEYLDQNDTLFAEALITYFQYRPAQHSEAPGRQAGSHAANQATDSSTGSEPVCRDIQFSQLQVGDSLPQIRIPITHKLIVGGAIATQDFIPVHHNVEAAKAAAMPDIFMNILTTSGLSARYLSDWAGPGSRLKSLKFKLLAPNTPGDTMIMQGRVSELQSVGKENIVAVDFAGKNNLGMHVSGSATLRLDS